MGVKSMAYSLKFVLDTWLKPSAALSSQIPQDQLQSIDAGTELPIVAIQPVENSHIKVTLGVDAQGKQIFFKGRNTWYIYNSAVQILRDGQVVMGLDVTSQTETSPAIYVIKTISDTWLKQNIAQGAVLSADQRQFLSAGTVLPISGFSVEQNDHLKVSFGKDQQGKQIFFAGRNTWYIYRADVQVLRDGKVILAALTPTATPVSVYVMKAVSDTWLKQSTQQASLLPNHQRQFLKAGTVLPLSGFSVEQTDHLKISLGRDQQGKQIFFQGRNTWYVYRTDVQVLRDGKVIATGLEPKPDPANPGSISSGRRQINAKGLQVIKSFEGLALTAYRDVVGVLTIGYGTTRGVRAGMRITRDQAEELLKIDLHRFETAVSKLVKVPINDNQFSALVSFSYNVGEGALGSSTLLRLLNQRNYSAAANEFLRWNRAGGRALAGLTRRRKAERSLFLGQDYTVYL
jgi:GH24 family phage-related lysozyme (muramidase)